ncbi:MAG TPA: class I SAM-dependent methyltransferase [Planctomycetota bacterium]|nr:class I SAM-dependent methyltransferase [Planctomycetota bacterium]
MSRAAARDSLITADENRRMFDAIARRYDIMNRLISLGLDRRWRRRAVELLGVAAGGRYLDVGSGTGDICIEILRREPAARVTGIDPSEAMLAIAHAKLRRARIAVAMSPCSQPPMSPTVSQTNSPTAVPSAVLEVGDALALPYPDGLFAGVISAFVIRNVENRQKALREMRRVLRPNGRVVILELTTPRGRIMRQLHRLYGATVLPLAARAFSNREAYSYLVRSVREFPAPDQFVELMRQAGLREPACIPLSGGIVTLFTGTAS